MSVLRPSPDQDSDRPGCHILWLGYPSYSHIKATFGIVEELCRRGHRVTYVVADRLADRLAGTGAHVVPYRSVFPQSLSSTETATTMLVEFLRESFAPMETALNCAAADPPDLVVHDALASDTAAVVSRRHGVPTVRTYAGFGANEQVQQNGTEAHPDHAPVDPNDPRLAELSAELTERITAAGVAPLLADGLASGDDSVLDVSFVTRAFQIKGETFGDEYLFAGPCLRDSDFTGQWSPPPGSPPVLLVSLGTTANRHPDFFRTCAESFAHTPWHVVMTLGSGVDPAELGTLPPNVEAHPWIPHLAVLAHASAFVTQGGTGSLMEAFQQGVPVVVVPQQWDQNAIAQQVVDLGVGLSMQPQDLDAESLRAAVEEVATDEEIRRRILELQHHSRTAPGAPGVADRFEAIVARSVAERFEALVDDTVAERLATIVEHSAIGQLETIVEAAAVEVPEAVAEDPVAEQLEALVDDTVAERLATIVEHSAIGQLETIVEELAVEELEVPQSAPPPAAPAV